MSAKPPVVDLAQAIVSGDAEKQRLAGSLITEPEARGAERWLSQAAVMRDFMARPESGARLADAVFQSGGSPAIGRELCSGFAEASINALKDPDATQAHAARAAEIVDAMASKLDPQGAELLLSRSIHSCAVLARARPDLIEAVGTHVFPAALQACEERGASLTAGAFDPSRDPFSTPLGKAALTGYLPALAQASGRARERALADSFARMEEAALGEPGFKEISYALNKSHDFCSSLKMTPLAQAASVEASAPKTPRLALKRDVSIPL